MNEITVWGGNPVIIATREEIQRGATLVGMAQSRLISEVEPFDFVSEPIARLVFATQLPAILIRLEQLKWACTIAGENYISGEARVANRVHWITQLVARHPFIDKLVPRNAVEIAGFGALGVAVGAQWFNGGLSKVLAREVVDAYPALTGLTSSHGNNSAAAMKALQGQLGPFGLMKAGVPELIAELPGPVVAPPASLQQLAKRVEQVHRQNEATVRIEHYARGDKKLFVVYVPGTRAKTILPNSDPFDLSNAAQLLSNPEKAASHDAVLDAIEREGIKKGDKVVMVGYSQGGTIAAEVAAKHHDIKVSAVLTLGAPVGHIHMPAAMPVISLEHSNDAVPALAGAVNPVTENWATVEREVPVAPGELQLHAHRVAEYVDTANLADQSNDPGLRRLRKKLLRLFNKFEFVGSNQYQYAK